MTTIIVTAAVVEREGCYLVTKRPSGVHLEGFWEFPGGKCEPDESLIACLERELREELAVAARIGGEILTTAHDYPDRRVELHFFACELMGEPQPQMQQEARWVRREELASLPFPPADAELIQILTRQGSLG